MQQKLRFKRKPYGWGWVPVTRQGWISILVYILGIYATLSWVTLFANSDSVIIYSLFMIVWTTLLIVLCYKTGEKPRRQRGYKKSDK